MMPIMVAIIKLLSVSLNIVLYNAGLNWLVLTTTIITIDIINLIGILKMYTFPIFSLLKTSIVNVIEI